MIQEQNIKLLKSEVMDDVDEGGGQATGNAITDGASNAIFPDISELDRTYGRVNLRKVFVGVQTPDTDKYFGANVIVADPPNDAKVSCTMFTTGSGFDLRTDAAARVEAYLFAGTKWGGYLFEDHIAGQRAIAIVQREGTETPPVGKTLVLRLNEGASNQVEQYVRVTRVSTVVRTFTDQTGDYKRMIVTCELSDALRTNFKGHAVNRFDTLTSGGAIIRDTNVADAARYYGVSKLVNLASTGELSAKVESIFTQLVPSAQTEVPATDVRANNDLFSPQLSSEGLVSITTSASLSPSTSLYVGTSIVPGTLTITGPATLTDSNGKLYNGSQEEGTVDYQNGVISTTSATYSGSKTITYKQAASPNITTESLAMKVTAENRSLSMAITVNPIPAPNTLSIHYQAQGRWYVIREKGSGAITGDDAAYGAGQLSFTTGGLSVTFGALPDVGSAIMMFWGLPTSFAQQLDLADSPRAYYEIDLGVPIAPNTLVISWTNSGSKTSSDSGGSLTGDATGKVIDYTTGKIHFSPNVLLTAGTTINLAYTSSNGGTVSDVDTFLSQGASWEVDLGGAVVPHTFSAEVYVSVGVAAVEKRQITDDGSGNVRLVSKTPQGVESYVTVGSINYATGVVLIQKTQTHSVTQKVPVYTYSSYTGAGAPAGSFSV